MKTNFEVSTYGTDKTFPKHFYCSIYDKIGKKWEKNGTIILFLLKTPIKPQAGNSLKILII